MAVFKSLTFDGENSLDHGVYITGEPVYDAPERAVEMVTIPGRNGTLAIDQGRFENIEVTYPAGAFGTTQAEYAGRMRVFRNILASRYKYVRLEDDYHPDEYRLGLYKSGLDVKPVSMSRAGEFNITFDCKPQRFLKSGDVAVTGDDWSDVQTETGGIVTVDNEDGTLAFKTVTATISPLQSLNGYSKPWAGGNGKNKFGIDASKTTATVNGITYTVSRGAGGNVEYINVNGTSTSSSSQFILSPPNDYYSGIDFSKQWYVSGGSTNIRVMIWVYDANKSYLGQANSTGSDVLMNFPNGAYYRTLIEIPVNTTISNKKVYPMLRLSSVSDATYEPYENICPISGHDEVVTSVVGKNLFNAPTSGGRTNSGVTWVYNSDGTVTATGTATGGNSWSYGTSQQLTLPKGTYTLSVTNPFGLVIRNLTDGGYIYNGDNAKTTFTLAKKTSVDVFARVKNGTTINATTGIQVELGTTATAYEPYNGQTYTTDLGRTVYGGTLDVTSGVLTVDRKSVDLGTLTWNYDTGTKRFYSNAPTGIKIPLGTEVPNIISDRYVATKANGQTSGQSGTIAIGSTGYLWVYDTNAGTSASAFKTAVTGSTLVYELATPQTYQLTPQQITALLGVNNLWASSGEVEVKYGVSPFYNPTEFPSKPLIKTVGTGTLTINGVQIAISQSPTTIDCEAMEAYNGATSRNGDIVLTPNEFPTLEPGNNVVVAGSGITTLEITPRWWRV